MSTSSSSEYGENIVINGNFNGNADGWGLSGGMAYENYHIVAEPSAVYVKKATQSLPIVAGTTYLVKYELTITGSATSSFYLGNKFVSFDDQQGILSSLVNVEDTQPLIINVVVQTGKIYITNVSVQELLFESSSSSSVSSTSGSSKSTSSLSLEKTTSSSNSSSSSSSEIKSSSSSLSSSSSSQTISVTSSSTSSVSSLSLSSISNSSSSVSSNSSSSLSISSLSSISSSSISTGSSTSNSSSSISSSSSRSSKSTSSSQILLTSSSMSSISSLSSSSSLRQGYFLVPFTFESSNGKQVWCFAKNENYIYAGTGPYGKVIRSIDCYNWEDFVTVDDNHVKSMFVWANGLFIGTQPHGKIYVYNFSSEKFYHFVQTEDSCVTCFAEYNGKLYAGTSPLGIIYRFDGTTWSRIYQGNGNGINSMSVYDNLLYVFLNNVEFAVVYDVFGVIGKQKTTSIEEMEGVTTNASSATQVIVADPTLESGQKKEISSDWNLMHIRTIEHFDPDVGESSSSSSSSTLSSLSSSSSQNLVRATATTETKGLIATVSSQENNKETFYSFRNGKYEPLIISENQFINRDQISNITNEANSSITNVENSELVKPTIGVKSILSSCANSNLLYMGSDNGIIFAYPDNQKNVKILYQKDSGKVCNILSDQNGKIIVAIDNELYFIDGSTSLIVKEDLLSATQNKKLIMTK